MEKAWYQYEKQAQNALHGKAPSLACTSCGKSGYVKFDGVRGNTMVDRKLGFGSSSLKQARRQEEALKQNDLRAVWEVPNAKAARRAMRILENARASRIKVKIVAP